MKKGRSSRLPSAPPNFQTALHKVGRARCWIEVKIVGMISRACRHPAVARSLRFMAENWRRAITVNDLIRVSAMSRRGFLKAFRRHTGCLPGRELQRIRMEHAQRLLHQSQTNSLNVGLSNNWYTFPGGSTSPVNVTINPTNPAVLFRLSLQ
jgi:AraC-like DNA-binding protein